MAQYLFQNVIEGPVRVYLGAGASDDTPDTLPEEDDPIGTPGGTWVSLGYTTRDGFAFGDLSPDRPPVESAQVREPIGYFPGNAAESVTFSLLETNIANVHRVSGRGTLTSDAAGSSTPGNVTLKWDDSIHDDVSLLIEGYGPEGEPRRYFMPQVRVQITGQTTHTIGAAMTLPVTATRTSADGVDTDPVWQDVLAPTG